MEQFDHIINWRLLAGSHDFPGPDGGTCINEAAIVAAGFPYQPVRDVKDMPPCFSRVIAQFALTLNDKMPAGQRQRLVPYVARLAGTSDTREVEQKRAEYLAMRAVNVSAARALALCGLKSEAVACRLAKSLAEAEQVANAAAYDAAAAANAAAAAAAAYDAAYDAANAAAYAAAAAAAAWDDALETLEGVLAIGNRATPVEAGLIVDLLERAKAAMAA